MRQRETEDAEDDRRGGGDLHRTGGVLEPEEADRESGRDPADGAEHADGGELPAGVRHLAKRNRVRERERRHVAERVGEQDDVEDAERRLLRRGEQDDPSRCMQDGEQPFGGEEAVGDHADEEGRDHRRDGRCAEHEADLLALERERAAEVGAERHRPCPPDEVLEEHHRREPEADACRHGNALGQAFIRFPGSGCCGSGPDRHGPGSRCGPGVPARSAADRRTCLAATRACQSALSSS